MHDRNTTSLQIQATTLHLHICMHVPCRSAWPVRSRCGRDAHHRPKWAPALGYRSTPHAKTSTHPSPTYEPNSNSIKDFQHLFMESLKVGHLVFQSKQVDKLGWQRGIHRIDLALLSARTEDILDKYYIATFSRLIPWYGMIY